MSRTIMLRLAVWCASLLVTAGVAAAGTVQPQVIGLFPKDLGEFAYVDLKAARRGAWYRDLKEQMLPPRFRQFEAYLAAAGLDVESQVSELVWGAKLTEGKEEIIGVVLGDFNPETAQKYFREQKLPSKDVRGLQLYSFPGAAGAGDLYFLFVDSNTAAFGHEAQLEKLVEARLGIGDNLLRNEKLYPRISEVNGRGMMWAVLDQSYTKLGLQQLAPEISQFPDAPKLVARIKGMLIGIDADRSVTASIQAICETVDDANLFASLLQAGIMFKRYEAGEKNPELAKMMDDARITPRGDRLEVRMNMTEEMLIAMLRRNSFGAKS